MAEENKLKITRYLSSEQRGDTLGFSEAKDKFASMIACLAPPMTVALYGKWGSGKTSMIEDLCEQLNDYKHVIFDAWEYRKEKSLVLPLMLMIKRECGSSWGDALKKSFNRIAGALTLSLGDILLKSVGSDLSAVKTACDIVDSSESLLDSYSDTISETKGLFKQLMSKIATADKPLIIYVDNLDRCLPDTVVQLLEDISAFLSYEGVPCIYVLAMDKDHVIKAIENKYSGFDGGQYLEKIVQIPLMMPQSKSLKAFFNSRFVSAAFWMADDKRQKLAAELDKLDKLFEREFASNPRRLERIIHRLILVYYLYQDADVYRKDYSLSLMVLFLMIKEYLPHIYDILNESKALEELIKRASEAKNPGGGPTEIARLAKDDGRKLGHYQMFVFDEYTKGGVFSELLVGYSAVFTEALQPTQSANGRQQESTLHKDIREIMDIIQLMG